jgi:hypothetical protein
MLLYVVFRLISTIGDLFNLWFNSRNSHLNNTITQLERKIQDITVSTDQDRLLLKRLPILREKFPRLTEEQLNKLAANPFVSNIPVEELPRLTLSTADIAHTRELFKTHERALSELDSLINKK